jgi:hypothetical protein
VVALVRADRWTPAMLGSNLRGWFHSEDWTRMTISSGNRLEVWPPRAPSAVWTITWDDSTQPFLWQENTPNGKHAVYNWGAFGCTLIHSATYNIPPPYTFHFVAQDTNGGDLNDSISATVPMIRSVGGVNGNWRIADLWIGTNGDGFKRDAGWHLHTVVVKGGTNGLRHYVDGRFSASCNSNGNNFSYMWTRNHGGVAEFVIARGAHDDMGLVPYMAEYAADEWGLQTGGPDTDTDRLRPALRAAMGDLPTHLPMLFPRR